MSAVSRLPALAAAFACACALLAGCSGDGGTSDTGTGVPMGWMEQEDEETGVGFALPPPISGPEEQERDGLSTPILARSYAASSGEVALSVQFLSTPGDPAALAREVRVDRVPYLLIDQMETEGPVEADVLSNQVVDEAEVPTYDARLQLASGQEEGVWWIRARELDDLVVVTQVVAIVDGDRTDVEAQVAATFERFNDTIEIPASLGAG